MWKGNPEEEVWSVRSNPPVAMAPEGRGVDHRERSEKKGVVEGWF